MKLKEFLRDVTVCHILGVVIAHIHVIEFQKRSLPHCHMLLHFRPEDKLRNAEDIDKLISAEIPDPINEPELHDIVKKCMIHGPCGHLNTKSICMKDGKCTKNFPKEFNAQTMESVGGYPKYMRRDNGRIVRVRDIDVDNRWVVPYNPWLSMKYAAHINVEACMSVKSVKYLYKYVYKGHDCAQIEINESLDHDEIKTFVDARYVSATEAAWRLFEFRMHQHSHTIVRLPVHLPDRHMVYFQKGCEEQAAERGINDTQLTAWFKLNQEDMDARKYLYTDIPIHYIFDSHNKRWQPRKRGGQKVISRMYTVNPTELERFYLRLLLLHVQGAKSYEDLRTVDGNVVATFQMVCNLRGLLNDDDEWTNALMEAANFQMPNALRRMFALILIHNNPIDPLRLWYEYRQYFIEDFARAHSERESDNMALTSISKYLEQHGKTLMDYHLPNIAITLGMDDTYDFEYEAERATELRSMLNDEQLLVADTVLSKVLSTDGFCTDNIFYLDGPGGSGKTFTYNYLVHELRGRRLNVATAAWIGIAATLLLGGRTVHSLFKLPVPLLETSTCNVAPTSKVADMLRAQSLFIIDEASMLSLHAFNALDNMLRDITGTDMILGGKVFLFGGDFRQVLPVVKRGHPTTIIESCLKSLPQWSQYHKLYLTRNMRAIEDSDFRDWLLKLGNGELHTKQHSPYEGTIEIPANCVEPNCIIKSIFGSVFDFDDFANRIILCPTNDESLDINDKILKLIPGDERIYYSADSIQSDNAIDTTQYADEFLHSLTPPGMPPHRLALKISAVVMLLRNVSIYEGLCNGTRLMIRGLNNNSIDAEIMTGICKGKRILLPRIQLTPSDLELPFILCRRQFPIRLAYSMTINKSQGQTFDKVGIYLQRPCFTHGHCMLPSQEHEISRV